MDKTIKRLLVISITIIFIEGCTPTNVNNSNTNRNASITHTHNGIAHTHKLPPQGLKHSHNIGSSNNNRICQPCAATNNNNISNSNCHLHEGRRHCHPLPASGIQHTHTAGFNDPINQQVNNPVIRYHPSTTTIPYPTPPINTTPPTYLPDYYQPDPYPTPQTYQPQPSYPVTNYIPPQNWDNPSCDTASGNYYIVKPKDGVYRIGVNNGVKRNDIIRLNNLQSPDYTIQPGQCLRLR